MLFGDAHIKIALRETLVELLETCTFRHSSGDTHDGSILLGQFYKCVGKDFCIGRWITWIFLHITSRIVECPRAMPLGRIFLSISETLALLRQYLHHDRAFNLLDVLKHIKHQRHIMPIKRSKELKAQFFKYETSFAMHNEILEACLGTACGLTRFVADERQFFDRFFRHFT